MGFLKDYSKNEQALGEYLTRRSPVLVGMGIAGALVAKNVGSGTMLVDAAALLANTTWTHRVFELRVPAGTSKAGRLTLGRTTTNTDITINDFTMSREQCAFVFEKTGISVVDIGSRNGTFVGSVHLVKPDKITLTSGDILTLGRLQFRFLSSADFLVCVKEFKPETFD